MSFVKLWYPDHDENAYLVILFPDYSTKLIDCLSTADTLKRDLPGLEDKEILVSKIRDGAKKYSNKSLVATRIHPSRRNEFTDYQTTSFAEAYFH